MFEKSKALFSESIARIRHNAGVNKLNDLFGHTEGWSPSKTPKTKKQRVARKKAVAGRKASRQNRSAK